MVLRPPLIGTEAVPFIPHPWEEIAAAHVFPRDVTAPWYNGQVKTCLQLQQDVLDCFRIAYLGPAGVVTGLAAFPKHMPEEIKLPLVIFNRGGSGEYGRLTAYNVVFPFADLVRGGYAVLASNYRGNDGGEGHEEFGGAEIEDVLALQALGESQPWWNGKTYMLGWSRGGMMTYLALKHGASVRAAATLAGVAEMDRSRFANRMPEEAGDREIAEELEARSATAWPERLTTPLLMMHGDADRIVDVSQSQALADQLAALSYDYKLVVLPAGGHSLSRYYKEIAAEVLAWFAAH